MLKPVPSKRLGVGPGGNVKPLARSSANRQRAIQVYMYDMPKSVEKWYKLWISQFPESWHPSDLERFYMFVSVLVHNARRSRDRYWLEKNMRADRPQLSEDDVEAYCDLFEHLRDYSNVWKSQQARLTVEDTLRKR